MKKILLLLTTALITTACNGGNNEPNSTNKESTISATDLIKMKPSDFDARFTIEVMEGQLKGTHVFKSNSEIKNQLFNISVKKGNEKKDNVAQPGSFDMGTIMADNSNNTLLSLSKKFNGMIKPGNHSANGSDAPLVFQNKNQSIAWNRANGEMKTNNDITFTHVGDWLTIKRKIEVRRVQGHFTDQFEFSYSSDQSLDTETVTVKVSFDLVQVYRP